MLTILSMSSLTNKSKSSGLESSVLFADAELPGRDTSTADEWTDEEVDGEFLEESVFADILLPNQNLGCFPPVFKYLNTLY